MRSDANCADLPSREALDELWALFAELGVEAQVEKVECVLPDVTDWQRPAAQWLRKASATVADEVPPPGATLVRKRRPFLRFF